jgi:hypothetical protein
MALSKRLLAVTRNPRLQAFVGLVMAATGAAEAIAPFVDEIEGNELKVGAHHGVLVYGVYMFLRSLGEVLSGVKDVREGLEKHRAATHAEGEVKVAVE